MVDALAQHRTVFAVLGGLVVIMVTIAALRRGDADDDSVPVSAVVGWAAVFLVPPMVGVGARIAKFSVPSALFASFLAVVLQCVSRPYRSRRS